MSSDNCTASEIEIEKSVKCVVEDTSTLKPPSLPKLPANLGMSDSNAEIYFSYFGFVCFC
jgi:hypothetical protein